MAQSYGPIYLHIVFGAKHRQPLLNPELHTAFAQYITPILKRYKSRLISEGGMADHVHLLIDLGRETPVAKLMQEIKAQSSKWMRLQTRRSFGWQSG